MEQSQVKPSHCCIQTPWLAHESSWQVVLGPSNSEEQERRKKERELFKLINQSHHLKPQNIQRHHCQKYQFYIMQEKSHCVFTKEDRNTHLAQSINRNTRKGEG